MGGALPGFGQKLAYLGVFRLRVSQLVARTIHPASTLPATHPSTLASAGTRALRGAGAPPHSRVTAWLMVSAYAEMGTLSSTSTSASDLKHVGKVYCFGLGRRLMSCSCECQLRCASPAFGRIDVQPVVRQRRSGFGSVPFGALA